MHIIANENPISRIEDLLEDILDEIIELEAYAKDGKRPPLAKGYRFKINDKPFVWTSLILRAAKFSFSPA